VAGLQSKLFGKKKDQPPYSISILAYQNELDKQRIAEGRGEREREGERASVRAAREREKESERERAREQRERE
jgi:hypothetical protein